MKKILIITIFLLFFIISGFSFTGKLIYSSNETGDYQIYIHDFFSNTKTNISNNSYNELNPKVSPGGKYIVFYSNRNGNNMIYKMDLNTFSVVCLSTGAFVNASNYDPVFSPDGTKIAFKSNKDDGYGDIFVMNSDGSNPINMTQDMSTSEEWAPDYTREGNQIVFTSRSSINDPNTDEIYIMNIDNGTKNKITNNSVPDWYPRTSPIQNLIIFISKTTQGQSDNLFVMDYSGNSRTSISSLVGDNDDPCYSSDGNKIVFINNKSGYYQIYLMEANGTNVEQLTTNTGYNILCPAFLEQSSLTPTFTNTAFITETITTTMIYTSTPTFTKTNTVTDTVSTTSTNTNTNTPTNTNTIVNTITSTQVNTPTPVQTHIDNLIVRKIILQKNLVNLSKNEQINIIIPNEFFGLEGKICVYTRNGLLVKEISKKLSNVIIWDGTNFNGKKVGAGIYLIRININNLKETLKVVIIR